MALFISVYQCSLALLVAIGFSFGKASLALLLPQRVILFTAIAIPIPTIALAW